MSSLTVSTINVNGIRAAVKQRSQHDLGLLPWLAGTAAEPPPYVMLEAARLEL